MHMDLETNMKNVGKRFPYYAKYTVSYVTFLNYIHFIKVGWEKK